MLTLVTNNTRRGGERLSVAAAHLQSAMAHLNHAARAKVVAPDAASEELEQLRTIVTALNDLLIDISALSRAS